MMEQKIENKTKCFRMVCDRKGSTFLDFIEDKQTGKFHQEDPTVLQKMKADYSSPFSKIYIQYEDLVQIKNICSIFLSNVSNATGTFVLISQYFQALSSIETTSLGVIRSPKFS